MLQLKLKMAVKLRFRKPSNQSRIAEKLSRCKMKRVPSLHGKDRTNTGSVTSPVSSPRQNVPRPADPESPPLQLTSSVGQSSAAPVGAVLNWEEWSGAELVQWLHAQQLPAAIDEACNVLADNLTGMFPSYAFR